MADPEKRRPRGAAGRFKADLRSLARLATDASRGFRVGVAANAAQERLAAILGRGREAPPAQAATPGQPMIPLLSLRRSLGRAAVPCEQHDACGGTIELALYEHTTTHREVGEATVLEATLISQTCDCDLSEDDRERVIDRVQRQLKSRG